MSREEMKGKKLPYSNELCDVLDYVVNNLSVGAFPTLNPDVKYFIYTVISERKSLLYKRLSENIPDASLDVIRSGFGRMMDEKALSALKPNRLPKVSDELQLLLNNAEDEAQMRGSDCVTTEHVFLALMKHPNEGISDKIFPIRLIFEKSGVNYDLYSNYMAESEMNNGEKNTEKEDKGPRVIRIDGGQLINGLPPIPGVSNGPKPKGFFIDTYCSNINDLVEKGVIDKIVGRDREFKQMTQILGRRRKNSLIILGEDGVGKTAIAENIAYRIKEGDVPPFLLNKKIVSLDMTALVAGTTLRGMFEERVKGILNDIKEDGNYLMLIDNIGTVMSDKAKQDYDISSMLARSIENGELQVIGTSDFKSYRGTFDKNPMLGRRFQKIIVEAPSKEESINILKGLSHYYEDFHNVRYTEEALNTCVELAGKYITERNLPDSAIDVMDEAGALISTAREDNDNVRNARAHLSAVNEEKRQNNDGARSEELDREKRKAENDLKKALKEQEKSVRENPTEIDVNTILEVVATKTGIPSNNLTADDKKKIATIEDRLKEGVIGQDEAIQTIARAIKRNRVGLKNGKTGGSFMLLGKTGVGKSLIAKKIAKELFGDESALVRFDMSEYPDKSAVNKLIGSNPGYIGYEEGGQLTEAIKNHKHCVLLLDEIEKADPEVYNIFLQVLDEGFLTDNSGMKVDFKNVIVLFTSNAGAKVASDYSKGLGFNENTNENEKRILLKQLKNKFPPEFLNRLDSVIYFNNLTDENLKDIIRLEMGKFIDRVNNIGYTATYDDGVVNYLLSIVKEEKEFGARPILRTIQEKIEDVLTDLLIDNTYGKDYSFILSYDSIENKIIIK